MRVCWRSLWSPITRTPSVPACLRPQLSCPIRIPHRSLLVIEARRTAACSRPQTNSYRWDLTPPTAWPTGGSSPLRPNGLTTISSRLEEWNMKWEANDDYFLLCRSTNNRLVISHEGRGDYRCTRVPASLLLKNVFSLTHTLHTP